MAEKLTNYLGPLVGRWLLPVIQTMIEVLGILLFGAIATYLLALLFRRLDKLAQASSLIRDDGEHQKRVSTILSMVKTIVMAGLWIVLVIMILSQAGLDVTPVLAGAGILGLAVGFGAQNLVRDLISGFFHIMENQIRVGDIAMINGKGGKVEKITYRIIVLRDLKQVVHVIPHGKVDTLANMTKEWSAMVLDVGVAYKEHPDKVIRALEQVGEEMAEDPDWKSKLLEQLEVMGVEEFADSAVVYRLRFMTRPIEQWGVSRELRRRIKIAFDKKGIEFPFPHRTLYAGSDSEPFPIRVVPDDGHELGRSKGASQAHRPATASKSRKTRAIDKAAKTPRP
jgi:small conductance mechanosensitive channel